MNIQNNVSLALYHLNIKIFLVFVNLRMSLGYRQSPPCVNGRPRWTNRTLTLEKAPPVICSVCTSSAPFSSPPLAPESFLHEMRSVGGVEETRGERGDEATGTEHNETSALQRRVSEATSINAMLPLCSHPCQLCPRHLL